MTTTRELIANLGRVHLMGAGGAGMSSLAKILHQGGAQVDGCDRAGGPSVEALRAAGVAVELGHSPAHLDPRPDLFVHTSAVAPSSEEVSAAFTSGIEVIGRAEMLARLVNPTRCVAVTGAHGKSTTSALVSTILIEAGRDPTFVIGTEILGLGSGGYLGSSDLSVVEADEAFGSFLHLRPTVGLMTNYDVDHLDHYVEEKSLKRAYRDFLEGADVAIVNAADPESLKLAPADHRTFGLDVEAEVTGTAEVGPSSILLTIAVDGSSVTTSIHVGGRHNAENALAAAAACLAVGLEMSDVARGLEAFRGTSRRFEERGTYRGARIIDDYAHLPKEVLVTIERARMLEHDRLIVVFQPHTYTRTKSLAREFAAALSTADVVLVTDVYAAREEPIPGVDGAGIVKMVAELGTRSVMTPTLPEAAGWLAGKLRAGDLVITMGAGDITDLPSMLSQDDD